MKLRFGHSWSLSFSDIYYFFFPLNVEKEIEKFQQSHPSVDIRGVLECLSSFIASIQNGDTARIEELLNIRDKKTIEAILYYSQQGNYYAINIFPLIKHVTVLEDGSVKIKGSMQFNNHFTRVNGFSHYFVFAKRDDGWVIVDTDFHIKLSVKYIFKFFIILFVIVSLIIGSAFLCRS